MNGLVVVTDSDLPEDGALEDVLGRAGLRVRRAACRTEDDVIAAASGADGLLVQWASVGERALTALPSIRAISRMGIGVDMIDLDAATRHGVPVANTPDYCVEEVALHALALALALLRGVVEHDGAIRAGRWEPVGAHPSAVRASETSIGILGFGRVGRRVVRGAAGLGFSVLVHDPLVSDDVIARAGARPVALDELFAASDLVSLHAPLTAATRRVVDERTLSLMRPGARIVNTTRGGLVDQDALVAALHDGRLGGAALDVFADEPLPPDAPLRQAPRTVLTAHAAWYSPAALRELPRRAAENLARLLTGDDVPAVLNPGYAAAAAGD